MLMNKSKPKNQKNMNVQSQKKRHKDTEKSERDENIAENYKILKKDFLEICSLI